ncbi:hypothetical protein ACIRF8_12995 [Streptomyces sp. NPDC102406]|uniref:hypothetical protein n=1 Tax=Streptomyces sp. NPDC102406 TaxID=3366171 RepID=UPI0037FCE5DD
MDDYPLRTAGGCSIQHAGAAWDAVRVPHEFGLRALSILGPRTGAVVETTCFVYWFVPAGTADSWDVAGTRAVGRGSWVSVPPHRRTEGPGPHWRVCPAEEAWLTDPAGLRAALDDARTTAPVTVAS